MVWSLGSVSTSNPLGSRGKHTVTTYSSQSCAEKALELIVRTTSLISSDPCLIKWNSPDPWYCQLGQRNAESRSPRGDLLKRHNHGLVLGSGTGFPVASTCSAPSYTSRVSSAANSS